MVDLIAASRNDGDPISDRIRMGAGANGNIRNGVIRESDVRHVGNALDGNSKAGPRILGRTVRDPANPVAGYDSIEASVEKDSSGTIGPIDPGNNVAADDEIGRAAESDSIRA
jgi:hypothetical protein